MKTEDYIKKWLNNSLSKKERSEFEKTPEFESLRQLSNSLERFKAPEYSQDKGWQRVQNAIDHQESSDAKQVNVNWFKPAMKVAAVVVVLISVFIFLYQDKEITVSTSIAEKSTVILPDSSVVILNSLSSITYDEDSWEEHRQVKMDGEALFRVSKGSDFEVITSAGNVKVLGTEFNVKQRSSIFEVICYEGLVQVSNEKADVRLKPNHIFNSRNGEVVVKEKALGKRPHLISEESAFYSTPYSEVLEEFERQYNVTILAPGINLRQEFSGRFTHNDMGLALKSISVPLGLSFNLKNNDEIILSKND